MINGHNISIEFGSNLLNSTRDFNTKTRYSKLFMNWNVQDEWYNGKESTR